MQKITQGQWTAESILEDYRIVVENEENDTRQQICHVTCFDHHVPNHEEISANAKLIAAAPDLFDMLFKVSETGALPYSLHIEVLAVLSKAII